MSRTNRYKLLQVLIALPIIVICILDPKFLIIPLMVAIIGGITQGIVWLMEWAERGE